MKSKPTKRVVSKSERDSDSVSVSVSDSVYWSGGHSKHRLLFHLVFIPKYRRRVLEGALAARVRSLFEQASEVKGWRIHELSIQPDHVHVLLQVHPRESVASVVQTLKGGSSRVLHQEFSDLEEFIWDESFWSVGYFAESIGQREEKAVRRYIINQREI